MGILISVVVLGLLFFSDGFFLYVMVAGTAVMAIIAWTTSPNLRRAATLLVVDSVLAAGVAAVLALLTRAAGVTVLDNVINTAPAAGELPGFLSASLGAIARDFNGDLPGQKLGAGAMPAALQVLLTIVVILLAVLCLRRLALRDPWTCLLWATVLVNVALYVATSNAGLNGTHRYVLLAAVLLLLLAVQGQAALQRRTFRMPVVRLLAGVGAIAVCVGFALNISSTAKSIAGATPDPQSRTNQIVDTTTSSGVTTGIANYWDANITTYYSSNRVQAVPLDRGVSVTRQKWFINRSAAEVHASRMFAVENAALGCTESKLVAQLGRPASRVPIRDGSGDAVLFYDKPLLLQ